MPSRRRNIDIDTQGADRLELLLAEKGWSPRDLARATEDAGNPARSVSYRTIYRILETGHRPKGPVRYEIAAALGLRPSQIWTGDVAIPELPTPIPAPALVAA